jgi:hypothetical protein
MPVSRGPRPTDREWEEAIKHMGKKAVPLLVRRLRGNPGLAWQILFGVQRTLPISVQRTRNTRKKALCFRGP